MSKEEETAKEIVEILMKKPLSICEVLKLVDILIDIRGIRGEIEK